MGDVIGRGAAGAALWLKEESTGAVVHALVRMEAAGAPTMSIECVDASCVARRGKKNDLHGREDGFSVELLLPLGDQSLSAEKTLVFRAVFKVSNGTVSQS